MMHEIKCKNPNCIGGRIETTMSSDSGYSNWTLMDFGQIEFKCHGCGKFATTDEDAEPNEPENFEVKCKKCGSTDWDYEIQDVECCDAPTHIFCKNCGAISEQETE
jgi:hypothetical protein